MQEKAVGDAKVVHRYSPQSPGDQVNIKAKSKCRNKYSREREAENKSFIKKKQHITKGMKRLKENVTDMEGRQKRSNIPIIELSKELTQNKGESKY